MVKTTLSQQAQRILIHGTEMGSIIYPYPYCGLVSAFNNKATYTLISFNNGRTVNGHDVVRLQPPGWSLVSVGELSQPLLRDCSSRPSEEGKTQSIDG